MVYCSSTNMSSQNESEVESLLMSPCWNTGNNGQDYMLDGHKLLLEHDLESLPSDSETQKNSQEPFKTLAEKITQSLKMIGYGCSQIKIQRVFMNKKQTSFRTIK